MRNGRWIAAVIMAVSAAACGGESPGDVDVDVSYARDVQAVWDRHCVTCHAGGNDLDLSAPVSHARLMATTTPCWNGEDLVEEPAVVPGVPEESVLWRKASDADPSYPCGREMPPFGTGGLIETHPADFATIEAWILAGAPDN